MTLQTDIFDRCTTGGHAGLSALIGDRCYPSRLVENYEVPNLRYRIISATDEYARDRDGAPGRAKYRVQFDCYAATSGSANALADQVVDAWSGYKGDGCNVGMCHFLNRTDSYNTQLNQFRVIVDIEIERATDT